MPFTEDILQCASVSVVGMEKNTGKTETLNYILNRLKNIKKQIAVTSIGIDGETTDSVYQTQKPEVEVFENMIFVTSERFFKEKRLVAEILDTSYRQTSLGKLVTAKAKTTGKVILSGPSDTLWLQSLIHSLRDFNVDLTLVDGALSRMSLASPTITEGMVLATGAAVSSNIPQLIKKTNFTYKLINLEQVDEELKLKLQDIKNGIWSIDEEEDIYDLGIPSVFSLQNEPNELLKYGTTLFVSGAISDAFLKMLRTQKQIEDIVLVIRDFTKAFISEEIYNTFVKKGGRIKVLQKTKLLAVTVNPVSPKGRNLNSEELQNAIQEVLKIPVYDVRKLK